MVPHLTGALLLALLLPASGAASDAAASYTFDNAVPTFKLCETASGLRRQLKLPQLAEQAHVPLSLMSGRSSLSQIIRHVAMVAPTVRFEVQPMAASLVGTEPLEGRQLPQLVHFTLKDKTSIAPHAALSIISWARLNHGYHIWMWDDADIRAFMTTHFSGLMGLFDGFATQVERTDLWRYLVLCHYGGTYADTDVIAATPIDQWRQDAGLLVGIENVWRSERDALQHSYTAAVQMVQWTIAAKPDHPLLCRMGDYVSAYVAREAQLAATATHEQQLQLQNIDHEAAILARTGPGIWTRNVHDYLRANGVTPQAVVGGARVADLRVLPQLAFGCPAWWQHPRNDQAYVYHQFLGSWRSDLPFLTKVVGVLHRLITLGTPHTQKPQQIGLRVSTVPLAAGSASEGERGGVSDILSTLPKGQADAVKAGLDAAANLTAKTGGTGAHRRRQGAAAGGGGGLVGGDAVAVVRGAAAADVSVEQQQQHASELAALRQEAQVLLDNQHDLVDAHRLQLLRRASEAVADDGGGAAVLALPSITLNSIHVDAPHSDLPLILTLAVLIAVVLIFTVASRTAHVRRGFVALRRATNGSSGGGGGKPRSVSSPASPTGHGAAVAVPSDLSLGASRLRSGLMRLCSMGGKPRMH